LPGLELEDRLDRLGAGAGYASRCGTIGVDPEVTGGRADGAGF